MNKIIDYLPYAERKINNQYQTALCKVMTSKMVRDPQFHEGTVRKFFMNGMTFKMKHGFPVITERRLGNEEKGISAETMMRYAIAEIIGFIHGATTLNELKAFGLPKYWWKRWTEIEHTYDKNGNCYFDLPENDKGEHLGRYSYGGIWGKFPTEDGKTINQWENVIKQMIKSPSAFTHRVVNWYPPGIIAPDGKRQVVVAPCHGDVQVELDVKNKLLYLMHLQRSADIPTGVPYNMIHYPVIGMMLACVLRYTFDTYHHMMIDSHIYNLQEENVRIMLGRKAKRLPTVTLDFEPTGDPVKDFFSIRPEHFHLSDYDAHPEMKVDTVL